jgi:hypothetical protein
MNFDMAEFFEASSIFDDFGTLQNNMDELKKLDMNTLSAADHVQAIKFYSFLKFRRFIQDSIKDEVKSHLQELKSEIHEEIKYMFKIEKQSFIHDLVTTTVNYDEKQFINDKQQFWTKKVTEKMDKFISKNSDKLTFSQIMKMPIEERMRHLSPS